MRLSPAHWRCRRPGFTLIELLVVITIIAILIGVGTYTWNNAQIKARDNKRKNDLRTIQQALELFYQENGYYPSVNSGFIPAQFSTMPPWYEPSVGCSDDDPGTDCAGVGRLVQDGYIKTLPVDPVNKMNRWDQANGHLVYMYGASEPDPQTYTLYANLENNNDPERNFINPDFWYDYTVSNP